MLALFQLFLGGGVFGAVAPPCGGTDELHIGLLPSYFYYSLHLTSFRTLAVDFMCFYMAECVYVFMTA